MTAKKYPTQSRLRELFDYDAETGHFLRKVFRHHNARIGDIAGTILHDGYLCIGVDRVKYLAHRLAWIYVHGGIDGQIDHINGIRTDNRIANLRDVTWAEQQRNKALSSNNTSGAIGVNWYAPSGKWLARIGSGDGRIHLGYFREKSDAIAARKAAERKLGYHANHGREPTTAA